MARTTRTAVVTGGARGIGLAISRRLAADGLRVVALDLARHDLEPSEPIEWLACDVSDPAAVRAAVAALDPAPTIAIHCAAYQRLARIDELTPEVWESTWRVNVGGAVNLVQAVLPGMRAAGGGRVVFITSSSFVTPVEAMSHYIASKGGLVGLARALSKELGPDLVTVNAVSPGLTATDNAVRDVPQAHFDLVRSRQALPRTGQPADQAAAVAFLVSDEASFITGQTLLVDGGEGHL